MASLVGEQQISSNNQEAEPVQKIESREGSVERKVCKDRDEKLKLARERQNEERQRKIEELKAQAEAAQRYREQKEEERRRRIEEIRQRDSEKRHQVEERKRAITEAEKERREYILRKNQERESRLETKKSSRSTVAFAFGSSTPRLLEPDFGLVSPSTYLGHRRSTSITNVTGASLSRRSSERELTDSGAKKRATSAGGTDRHEDDSVDSHATQIVFRSVARRKTDLMPTIPSPRDGHYGSRSSLSHTPRTPGSRSGNVTPGGNISTSRPGSAMSTSTNMSTSGYVARRSVPATRKQRPASIAGTGMSLEDLNKHKKDNRPPVKGSPSSTTASAQNTPKRTSNLMSTSMIVTSSSRLSSAEKKTPAKRDSVTPKSSTPKSLSKTSSSDRLNRSSKDIMSKSLISPSPSQTLVKSEKDKVTAIEQKKEVPPPPPVQSKEEKNSLNIAKSEAEYTADKTIAATEATVVAPDAVGPLTTDNVETVAPIVKANETKAEQLVDTAPIESKQIDATTVVAAVEQQQVLPAQPQPQPRSQNGSKENSEVRELTLPAQNGDNTDLMSASMIAKNKITTEEEAKAALAERRRLAREEAERQAELERQRLEAERLAELKRQEEEAERQRAFEEEANHLAEEQRRAEEERLRQAIEEAKQKEEEERRRREEEEKQRVQREEAERKAKEEAEKQRLEVAERLKREEKEREERRKRVEAIMSRTRKGAGGSGSATTPNSTPVKESTTPKSTADNLQQETQQDQSYTSNAVTNAVVSGSTDSSSTSGSTTTATTPNPPPQNNAAAVPTAVVTVVSTNVPAALKENINEPQNTQAMYEQAVIDKEAALINSFSNMLIDENAKNLHQQQQHQHQHEQQQQQSVSHSPHDLNDSLSFLNETLDLSQEDIQRTLIANMPFGVANQKASSTTPVTAAEAAEAQILSSIDFLEGNCGGQSDDEILVPGVTCEGDDEDADDVFANLDAFDMLVEFPELDLDDKQALSNAIHQQHHHTQQQQQQQLQQQTNIHSPLEQLSNNQPQCDTTLASNKKILNICDFSPEWAYTDGGVKVLVVGPWTNNASYTLLFDAQPVPTQLIQEGVLRCCCPPHEAGFATLQVSCNNFIISDTVLFEYKTTLCQEPPFDANTNDCLYKFTLLNRLALIDEKMQVKAEATATLFEQQTLLLHKNFEEQLVSYCQQLMKRVWLQNGNNWSGGFKGMTLLHLTAALGYSKLVCALLNWRSENPNIVLETEIDALSRDVYGYTPMAWACAYNHLEMAVILYKWNHNALKIKDNAHQTPLDIAHYKGHKVLMTEIYRLEEERNTQNKKNTFGTISLSLNKYALTGVHSKSLNSNEQLYDVKDNEHVFNSLEALDMQRSHDGVFLRPVAVASNQSPPNASRFSKRSSVDSGINMDIRTKSGKSFKDVPRLQSFESHDNFNLAVESSLDALAATNTTNILLSPTRKMDFALCEVSTGDSSPLPDKDHDDTSTINNDDVNDVTINNENDGIVGDSDAKVLTLAEHIIAAMPEHIKNEADEMMVLGSPLTEPLNSDSPSLNNGFMDPLDSLPNTHFESFDFNDHSYRYHDVSTPCSSLSPASSGPLQSPASYSILGADPTVSSPSPPPSTKQLTEFLHASSNSQYPFEADFSKLTLTDTEQRELYEAAKCIQKAYRSYKGRQKLEEQNKERTAAIVIQNYYRRYKQYAYYRQMTNAALVIQHGYRSYCRNKRFKKSQSSMSTGIDLSAGDSQSSPTSQCLSSFYDHFRNDQQQQQQQHLEFNSQPNTPKETSPSGPLKRTYSQSTQNQAARKIQQFMRQSRINIWDGNLTTLTAERTSRKREAGAPTQGGIPSKLAVSRTTGNCLPTRKK
uniref:Calmodulin-binding transcription activator 1 n=1 Tax=Ceratitis capitata TaxID=7213 RepID=W8BP11_CERCA